MSLEVQRNLRFANVKNDRMEKLIGLEQFSDQGLQKEVVNNAYLKVLKKPRALLGAFDWREASLVSC
jgi:hypothetical protein